MGRVDVALEEYKQLRAEILAHTQAQTTVVSIALTATAAIGAVAFGAGSKDSAERLQILLALPPVLIGLGLTYLAHSVNTVAIGQYIGQKLWPALAAAQPDDPDKAGGATVICSWEHVVASGRGLSGAATHVKGWLSVVPGLFLFGFPGVPALAINYKLAWIPRATDHSASGLRWAWFLDAVAIGIGAILLAAAARHGGASVPSTSGIVDDAQGASATLQIAADMGDHRATGTAVLRRSAD